MSAPTKAHLWIFEEDSDTEGIDLLTRRLREELRDLDVDEVTIPRGATPPPEGARAFDVALAGALLVGFGNVSDALSLVMTVLQQWVEGGRARDSRRSLIIEIDGDRLELSATSEEQTQLVMAYIRRHSPDPSASTTR